MRLEPGARYHTTWDEMKSNSVHSRNPKFGAVHTVRVVTVHDRETEDETIRVHSVKCETCGVEWQWEEQDDDSGDDG